MDNAFYAAGVLDDHGIAAALRKAADDFENGEIVEVHDRLVEITEAIEEWEDAQHV